MTAAGAIVLLAFATLATLLAGLVMAAQAWSRRMDQREREIIATTRATAEQAAQYAAQTARLEQRVRVLETMLPRQPDGPSPAAMPQFN
jgi:Flp pilus assembly protein TadB